MLIRRATINVNKVDLDWSLDSVDIILSMGNGICGEMFILRNNSCREIYAAKAISYEQIKKSNFFKYLTQEKEVLENLKDKFFLPGFCGTFRYKNMVVFLYEYVASYPLYKEIESSNLLNNLRNSNSRKSKILFSFCLTIFGIFT